MNRYRYTFMISSKVAPFTRTIEVDADTAEEAIAKVHNKVTDPSKFIFAMLSIVDLNKMAREWAMHNA